MAKRLSSIAVVPPLRLAVGASRRRWTTREGVRGRRLPKLQTLYRAAAASGRRSSSFAHLISQYS